MCFPNLPAGTVAVVIGAAPGVTTLGASQPRHLAMAASSWRHPHDGTCVGGPDSDSQALSESDNPAKSDLIDGISNFVRMTIFDLFAPGCGATVLGVTRGVAHHLVRGTPNRRSRPPRPSSMSLSLAPRSNYGIRPYVQSMKWNRVTGLRDPSPEPSHVAPLMHSVSYLAFCTWSVFIGRKKGSRLVNEA